MPHLLKNLGSCFQMQDCFLELNYDPMKKILKIRCHLYFNEESGYFEESTSETEVFCFTIK